MMSVRLLFVLLTSIFIIASTYHTSYAQSGEICDNAIDDDGDGLIDLNDLDCECNTTPISHIPNPSFEKITCCPYGNAQLHCAGTWIQASEATTDYYNQCGYFVRDGFPVPLPIPDGKAYIGFRNGYFAKGNSGNNGGGNFGGSFGNNSGGNSGNNPDNAFREPNPNWKEYTGACLLAPLEAGKQYTIQFYIGFVSSEISPPMSVVLYGTTDCDNLPFGSGDREYGCPTKSSAWQVLGQVYVSGNQNWKQYSITTIPRNNIAAIAIGPDCVELDLEVDPYYFLDELILAGSDLFGPTIETIGHPCQPNYSILASEKKNAKYQWYRDGVAIPGAVNRELKLNGMEGNYQVRVIINNNCVLSDPFRFTIPVFSSQPRVVICSEEAYPFGDKILNRSGSYTNTFQSVEGCDSIVDLELIILEDNIDSVYAYFFKGETYRIGPYNFRSPGTANLTLTSSLGCDSLVFLTLEEYSLYIPNAFSPNDDGINDYFTVYGSEEFIEIQVMSIFDRWGNRVYDHQKEYPFRWDGTANGREMDSGMYIYVLEVMLYDGNKKLIQGDVTLLR